MTFTARQCVLSGKRIFQVDSILSQLYILDFKQPLCVCFYVINLKATFVSHFASTLAGLCFHFASSCFSVMDSNILNFH